MTHLLKPNNPAVSYFGQSELNSHMQQSIEFHHMPKSDESEREELHNKSDSNMLERLSKNQAQSKEREFTFSNRKMISEPLKLSKRLVGEEKVKAKVPSPNVVHEESNEFSHSLKEASANDKVVSGKMSSSQLNKLEPIK